MDWGGAPPAGCNSQAPWAVASWHWIWPKGDKPEWETGGGREEKIGVYLPRSEQISRSHMSPVLQLPLGDTASGLWYPLLLPLSLQPVLVVADSWVPHQRAGLLSLPLPGAANTLHSILPAYVPD